MRADAIASHGRTGLVSARGISSSGVLSRLLALGTLVRDSIHAFVSAGVEYIKHFRAIAEMDRTFTGRTEM